MHICICMYVYMYVNAYISIIVNNGYQQIMIYDMTYFDDLSIIVISDCKQCKTQDIGVKETTIE